RHCGFGEARAAVVARFAGGVAQVLVDREDRAVPAEDAPAFDEDLVRTCRGTARWAGARAGGVILPLQPTTALDDVPVVGGDDDGAAGTVCFEQEGPQVPDVRSRPAGAAWVGAVQGVVDGVEDAGDQRGVLGIGDGGGDACGQCVACLLLTEVGLVEQGGAREARAAGQGRDPLALLLLRPRYWASRE